MKRVLWFAGLSVLLLLPLAARSQESAETLVPGEEAIGTLDADIFAVNYVFVGSEGDAITLDAFTESETLALVLLLTAPDGSLVAQDSDLTTPEEALIADFVLPQNGQYVVTVIRGSGGDEEGGDYTLTLSGELTPPPAASAEPAPTTDTTAEGVETGDGSLITLEDGGVEISIAWAAAVNLDIEVRDPVGGALYAAQPAADSGGLFNGDVNASCASASATAPTETVSWPAGTVPAGSYEIIIYYTDDCDIVGPQAFEISASVNNEDALSVPGLLNEGQRYLAALEIAPDGTWQLLNGGVNADLGATLLSVQIANATPILPTNTGSINRTTPGYAYTFEGIAGDTAAINVDANSGSLDTYLMLLRPDGSEIARNDDRDNLTTNSSIIQQLDQNGQYTVVVTRYGQTIGGTEGDFTLTFGLTPEGALIETLPTTDPAAIPSTTGETIIPTPTAIAIDSTTVTRPADLPQGSIEVILTWQTTADVQLLVRDPQGTAIYDDVTSSPSGGIQALAGNARCTGNVAPVSYIYWPPSLLPKGTFEIDVWYQDACQTATPVIFNLVVNVGGQTILNETQPITLNGHFGSTFEIAQDNSVTVGPSGFFNMDNSASIDYVSQLASADRIDYNDVVQGSITGQDRYQLYSFDGDSGDRVRISLQATSGTLDTAVYLIGPEGVQLANNDDIVDPITGERSTNSLIDGIELTSNGTYYVLATHYGLQYGGTTGTYNLIVSRLP